MASTMALRSNPPLAAGSRDGRAPVRAPSLATTFGIEFECVLALHESKLYRMLEENFIAQNETEDTPIKPTIEFRQHACSLDAEEIQHWFDLLFAIVRVAEVKVAQVMKSGGHDPVDRKGDFAE